MNAANPYAPPRAAVGDVDADGPGVQPVRMWSAKGRIGRLRYMAHTTGAYVVLVAAAFLGGVLSTVARSPGIQLAITWSTLAAFFVFWMLKTIQRSHDMDWSGWSSILAFIPIVNLIWLFKGGARGANRYGAPPPENTLGVKILGLFLPIIMVVGVGIMAAIAIPAYQQYVKAARAAQTR